MLFGARIEGDLDQRQPLHRSVLLRESVELVHPSPGAVIVDGTVGAGGHAQAFLEAVGSEGRVFGFDRDPDALLAARRRLGRFGDRFVPVHGDFRDLVAGLSERGVFAVDGILVDLGISSLQLDDPERGFSFRADGPLDMRMDRTRGRTAAELLAELSEDALRRLLRVYGEEKLATRIARTIVRARAETPITRTTELARLVERAAGPGARKYRIHPATRTFQALRIAVNGEVDGLERFVNDAVSVLRRGGRLVVISFHSLEDRAIKHAMRSLAERCICPPGLPVCGCGRENLVRVITGRPVRPSREETASNPRARSARLRAVERL